MKIFQNLSHGSPKKVQVYPTHSYPTHAFQGTSGQSVHASPVPSTKASQSQYSHHTQVVSITCCQGHTILIQLDLLIMFLLYNSHIKNAQQSFVGNVIFITFISSYTPSWKLNQTPTADSTTAISRDILLDSHSL